MGGTIYQIAGLAGFIDAFGVILGAIAAKGAIVATTKLSKLIQ
jgi:hypothetical protein